MSISTLIPIHICVIPAVPRRGVLSRRPAPVGERNRSRLASTALWQQPRRAKIRCDLKKGVLLKYGQTNASRHRR